MILLADILNIGQRCAFSKPTKLKAISLNEYTKNAAGFPPLIKGGQGGFWRQRGAIPWQNPPQPPFCKGGVPAARVSSLLEIT